MVNTIFTWQITQNERTPWTNLCWNPPTNMLFSIHHTKSIIFNYKCQCGAEYIRRNKRSEKWTDRQVPNKIRRWGTFMNTFTSLIAEYLNNHSSSFFFTTDFSILINKGHSDYNLRILGPIYIDSDQSSFYKQKEWLLELNVILL